MVKAKSLKKPSEIIYSIRDNLKKNTQAIKQAILLRNQMDDLHVRFERARKNGKAGFLKSLPNAMHVLKVMKSNFCIYGLRLTYRIGELGSMLYMKHGVRWSDDMACDEYDATQHDDDDITSPPPDEHFDDDNSSDDDDEDEIPDHELSILSLTDEGEDDEAELDLSVLDDEDVAAAVYGEDDDDDIEEAAGPAIPIYGRDN